MQVPLDNVRPYSNEEVALAEEQRKLRKLLKKESWNSDDRDAVRKILDDATHNNNPYVTSKMRKKAEDRLAQYSQPDQNSDELRRLREKLDAAQRAPANQINPDNRTQGNRGGCQDVECIPNSNERVQTQRIAHLEAEIERLKRTLADDGDDDDNKKFKSDYIEARTQRYVYRLKDITVTEQEFQAVVDKAAALSNDDLTEEYQLLGNIYDSAGDVDETEVQGRRVDMLLKFLGVVRPTEEQNEQVDPTFKTPVLTLKTNEEVNLIELALGILGVDSLDKTKEATVPYKEWETLRTMSERLLEIGEMLDDDRTSRMKKREKAKEAKKERMKELAKKQQKEAKIKESETNIKERNEVVYNELSRMWRAVDGLDEESKKNVFKQPVRRLEKNEIKLIALERGDGGRFKPKLSGNQWQNMSTSQLTENEVERNPTHPPTRHQLLCTHKQSDLSCRSAATCCRYARSHT